VLIERGHWQQALENAEKARHDFAAGGDHFQLAISLYTILEVLYGRGELIAGVARGREEVGVYERLGLQMIGKGVYIVMGQLLTKVGDAEGITIGREVLARAAQGNDKLSTAWAQCRARRFAPADGPRGRGHRPAGAGSGHSRREPISHVCRSAWRRGAREGVRAAPAIGACSVNGSRDAPARAPGVASGGRRQALSTDAE